MGLSFQCLWVFTNDVLSFQLAYCVVQFMEKDATVTEYVRFLQCLEMSNYADCNVKMKIDLL